MIARYEAGAAGGHQWASLGPGAWYFSKTELETNLIF